MATSFTDLSISQPDGITSGPDGALWFTNYGNNTIGRITTTGMVSNYATTNQSILSPVGIAAGPGQAMWFTSFGNNTIGEVATQ